MTANRHSRIQFAGISSMNASWKLRNAFAPMLHFDDLESDHPPLTENGHRKKRVSPHRDHSSTGRIDPNRLLMMLIDTLSVKLTPCRSQGARTRSSAAASLSRRALLSSRVRAACLRSASLVLHERRRGGTRSSHTLRPQLSPEQCRGSIGEVTRGR